MQSGSRRRVIAFATLSGPIPRNAEYGRVGAPALWQSADRAVFIEGRNTPLRSQRPRPKEAAAQT